MSPTRLRNRAAAFLTLAIPDHIPWTNLPAPRSGSKRGGHGRLHQGWPDFVIVQPPTARFVGIELTSSAGRVSPEQAKMHDSIALAGGCVFTVRSLEDLEGVLRALDIALCATLLPGGGFRIVA